MPDFQEIFDSFTNLKVAVIGDVMLDTYWFGSVDRISPEGPVPVVVLKSRELRIGGAGNVALNVASLGATATLFTIVGDDEEAKQLVSLYTQNNIQTDFIVKSADRITTNKTRIISRNQQMLRLDAEVTHNINEREENALLTNFKKFAADSKPAVVIFEDYNKGVLTPFLISEIIAFCNKMNIVTTVDPKRKNFLSYKGATIFKPNLGEVKDGLNLLIDEINETTLQDIHSRLKEVLGHQVSLITLSERGVFYQHDNHAKMIPSHIRKVADVSGAGDTVIAVASLLYAATRNVHLSASVANIAGGLVCEEVGTAAINKQKLLEECIELMGTVVS